MAFPTNIKIGFTNYLNLETLVLFNISHGTANSSVRLDTFSPRYGTDRPKNFFLRVQSRTSPPAVNTWRE